jgi:hypothetical protein
MKLRVADSAPPAKRGGVGGGGSRAVSPTKFSPTPTRSPPHRASTLLANRREGTRAELLSLAKNEVAR